MALSAVEIELTVDNTMREIFSNVSSAICSALIPVATAGVTIYIIVIGYAIVRGEVHNSIATLAWKFVRIGLICSIALVGGQYQSLIVGGINAIQGDLQGAVAGTVGGSPRSIVELLDQNSIAMQALVDNLGSEAMGGGMFSMPDFRLLLAAALVILAQCVMELALLGPLLIAKASLVVLFAFGPVFIFLACWPATQRFTESWLAATLTAMLTLVVLAVVSTGLLFYTVTAVANMAAADTSGVIAEAIGLVVVMAMFGWVAWRAGEMAGSMVGGAGLGHPAGAVASTVIGFLAGRSRVGRMGHSGGAASATDTPNVISQSSRASRAMHSASQAASNAASAAHRMVLGSLRSKPG